MSFLGISNMRVTTPGNRLDSYIALGQQGIKFDAIAYNTDLATQMGLLDKIAPYVEYVEGPNEVNEFPQYYNGLGGAAAADAYQADLYKSIHSDPNLAGVKVLPFSLSIGLDITGYGDVSASADLGNVHAYAGGGAPPYDQLSYWASQLTTTPGKPQVITETGYTTTFDPRGGVTQDVQAKWLMDTLLGNYTNGIVKTFIYQLEDSYAGSGTEQNYGLYTVDGTPKQAATDVHNLTSILADKGANAQTFTPGTLNYTVSGLDPEHGFQNVFAKSNGSFDVALWSEPSFFNASTGQESDVTPSNVTVALQGTYDVDVFDPVLGTSAITHAQGVSSINVQLSTDPLIVEVTPTGGGTVAATPVSATTTATSSDTTTATSSNTTTATSSNTATTSTDTASAVTADTSPTPAPSASSSDATAASDTTSSDSAAAATDSSAATSGNSVLVFGPDTLGLADPAFISSSGASIVDAGTNGGQVLAGGSGRNLFVLHAGSAADDVITNFQADPATGDVLELAGYGADATLTQVDQTTWTVGSASANLHDTIHLNNAASLVPANVAFA
jgi:hypothetical protein